MSASTNSLVNKVKLGARKYATPVVLGAAIVGSATLFLNHNGVHAASFSATPLDDNSVSSLVALDNAVESVAARVTPAVVNIAVTSKSGGEADDDSDADSDDQQPQQHRRQQQRGQSALPPGFEQFFGPGSPFGQGQGQPQQPQIEHGIGSGVIISPDGYIVTNNHVIDGATQIKVTLNDRRVLTGKLVGTDKLTDIAVIKVDAHDLPSIAWGDSAKLHPGQTVLAFGSPFGSLQFSVTRGIVSALNRPNNFSDNRRAPGGLIQTDAAINPGNSGGPLVNAHGELVGINNGIMTSSGSFAGAGFAIPSLTVRNVADQIIKSGAVHHGYLGISMNDVTPENASFFKLKDADGAIVSQVSPDSPAAKAGMKSGDVIRSLDGQPIINGGALQVIVSQDQPGTSISLGILRDGAPQTLSVKVGEFHAKAETAENDGDSSTTNAKPGKLGVSVGDLTPDLRQQLRLPDEVHGVAVQTVRPESPADEAGLAPGDVILELNRQPVASADKFVSAVRANPASKDILLLVWSRGGASYRVVHPANAG
ncbi:serine protease Do [Granulicella aggregans]|uniref:Serine protease Do n=1 Tax=Granulicella aggregans TaxID=474949 RepID=A0A7W8E5Q1_9BACT|nr:Do family serine endopeptidase [Granulicella aggregans]MBB5059539.1 serine protease Do [Granulicella aggregans]